MTSEGTSELASNSVDVDYGILKDSYMVKDGLTKEWDRSEAIRDSEAYS